MNQHRYVSPLWLILPRCGWFEVWDNLCTIQLRLRPHGSEWVESFKLRLAPVTTYNQVDREPISSFRATKNKIMYSWKNHFNKRPMKEFYLYLNGVIFKGRLQLTSFTINTHMFVPSQSVLIPTKTNELWNSLLSISSQLSMFDFIKTNIIKHLLNVSKKRYTVSE